MHSTLKKPHLNSRCLQIIDSVNELKKHKDFNLALQLLKKSEHFFEDEESLGTIRFMIMEILYNQVCIDTFLYCV